VTLDQPTAVPAPWPAAWLQPEASGTVLRFVDTHFDAERTPAELRSVITGVRDVAANGMPLRAIFVALAKAGRRAAA